MQAVPDAELCEAHVRAGYYLTAGGRRLSVCGPMARKILLVEDDGYLRDAIEDVLEDRGFDVIPAGNGKQALDFLAMDRAAPPDLMILDLMLPLITGWQVLEIVRRDPRYDHMPVLVLTGVSQDRPVGATAILHKPVPPDTLVREVEAGFAGTLDSPAGVSS
jgi:two-component system, OmpR family, response regulator CpxR